MVEEDVKAILLRVVVVVLWVVEVVLELVVAAEELVLEMRPVRDSETKS